MADTLTGAIKEVVDEAELLGEDTVLPVLRDDGGKAALSPPYITVSEGIVITPDRLGDNGASDPVTELVQVDLWQRWRNADQTSGEASGLAAALELLLDGASFDDPPTHVRACTVDSVVRLVERDSNVVHHALTLRIRRER